MELLSSINVLYHQGLEFIKLSFVYICFLLSTFTIILWMSIFLYGCFYYIYMPTDSHTYPIYWQFNSGDGRYASYPNANISLTTPLTSWQRVIVPDQQYRIVLEMELPDSPNNRHLGMFMCHIRMMASNDAVILSSRRFAMLHYQSSVMRFIKTVTMAPLLLLSFRHEKHMMGITLFEKYVDNKFHPASYAWIELESDRIELYASYLKIHAQYKGLRYIMFNWPTLSALYGVCSNAAFLSLLAILSWYQFLVRRGLFPSPTFKAVKSESIKKFEPDNVEALLAAPYEPKSVNWDPRRSNTKTQFTYPSHYKSVDSPLIKQALVQPTVKEPESVLRRRAQSPRADQESTPIKNREILEKEYGVKPSAIRFDGYASSGESSPKTDYSRPKSSLQLPTYKGLGQFTGSNDTLHPHRSFQSLDQYMSYNMPVRLSQYLPNNKEKTISRLVQQLDLTRSLSHGNIIDFNLYDEALSDFENKNLFLPLNKKLCFT